MRRKKTNPTLRLLAGAILVLLTTACSTAPRGTGQEDWREYLSTLERLRSSGEQLTPGGEEERRAVEAFQDLLSDYTAPDFVARIGEVYAEDVFFNDTLKTVRGLAEVEEHFAKFADTVDVGTVEFLDLTAEDGDYYFRWAMTVRAPKLAKGEEVLSVGMSHVRFDSRGKVVLHQDFWDSTGGLFEHTAALGWLLRRAKQRL